MLHLYSELAQSLTPGYHGIMTEYNTAQIAARLNVHDNTIRDWTRRYGDMLSERANMPKRKYTPDDLLILATIAHYRDRGISFESISDMLTEGTRIEADKIPPEITPDVEQAKDKVSIMTIPEDTYLLEQGVLQRKIALITQELDTTKERLATSEADKEALQARVIELERDLSSATAKLEIIAQERKPAIYWLTIMLGVVIAVSLIIAGITLFFAPG